MQRQGAGSGGEGGYSSVLKSRKHQGGRGVPALGRGEAVGCQPPPPNATPTHAPQVSISPFVSTPLFR